MGGRTFGEVERGKPDLIVDWVCHFPVGVEFARGQRWLLFGYLVLCACSSGQALLALVFFVFDLISLLSLSRFCSFSFSPSSAACFSSPSLPPSLPLSPVVFHSLLLLVDCFIVVALASEE